MDKTKRRFIKNAALVGTTAMVPSHVIASEKKYQWKMVTAWPKNFPGVGIGANNLAKRINQMSSGRLKIKVFGAGELVPALGVFDAVKRGTAEMGHAAAYYWKGKHPATNFFTTIPFGLNALEINAWLNHGGGQQLWDELYSQFGLKSFAAGNSGVQMGGWFNKEINSIKDFKGLKIRMSGLGGEVLKKQGATVVTIPGGELFQSMKSGAIDAAEWIGPYNDLAFGFHKTAKFYYWPGWHEPGAVLEGMVNLKAYNKLPKDLQHIVKEACKASNDDIMSEFTALNSVSLKTLVTKHKVVLKKFPDSVLKTLEKTSRDVVSQVAQKDPLSQKIYNSFEQFRKQSINYSRITEEGYLLARQLTLS